LTFNAVGPTQLQVLTTDGKILQKVQTAEPTITLDVNNLAQGVYFIQLENGGKSLMVKFIKQ
jgi:hypothetical protein